jgi:class 3 adenylate cyclase
VGGKAVLLGPDSIEDRHPTPYYTAFSGLRYNTAGVEIHANTLRTVLESDYLAPEFWLYRLIGLLLVAGLTAVAAVSLAASRTAYWLVAGMAVTAVLTHLMFRAGVMVSTSELLLVCLISVLASMIYRILTAETFGALFQNAISIFVGKKFAATLSEEQNISLSGSRQLVTILFSDIRGFTAFCEEKDPALVVDLLNEYMGAMVKIIVSHQGCVNKFIGDGILAIFSDEDGSIPGDHALRAVRCGTEMAQFVGKFKTGVGIHSGMAVVGNVGSQDKMEYTVLGDTVNLASRLESLNKDMKTQLILSEATRELLDGKVETAYLGEVPVRGKSGSAGNSYGRRAGYAESRDEYFGGEIMRCRFLTVLLSTGILFAQGKKEEPVGLVLQPGGAKLIRAGVETPLAARSGDILFAGDAIKTESAAASFLYCPSKSSQSLGPSGDALFGPSQVKIRAGKLADAKPVSACFLPQVIRVAVASQQHYGVSMTRGLERSGRA